MYSKKQINERIERKMKKNKENNTENIAHINMQIT